MPHVTPARKMAFCGMLCALGVLLLLLGGVLAVLSYAAPVFCGLLVLCALERCGRVYAWSLYGATALLGILLSVQREGALFFAVFAGYYPMFRRFLEGRVRAKPLRLLLELLLFNGALLAISLLMALAFFGGSSLLAEAPVFLALYALLSNLLFFVYDLLLGRLATVFAGPVRLRFIKKEKGNGTRLAPPFHFKGQSGPAPQTKDRTE